MEILRLLESTLYSYQWSVFITITAIVIITQLITMKYLSGLNFSGSFQYDGLWWIVYIGMTTAAPLGIVTPPTMVVLL